MSLRSAIYDATRGQKDSNEVIAAMAFRSSDLVKAMEHLTWVAQTIHQAHHTDQSGTWLICPKSICESTARLLAQVIK